MWNNFKIVKIRVGFTRTIGTVYIIRVQLLYIKFKQYFNKIGQVVSSYTSSTCINCLNFVSILEWNIAIRVRSNSFGE